MSPGGHQFLPEASDNLIPQNPIAYPKFHLLKYMALGALGNLRNDKIFEIRFLYLNFIY